MYSRDELFLRSLERYFGVYVPRCFAIREIKTKISLSWALKQFVTRVHTSFSIYTISLFRNGIDSCATKSPTAIIFLTDWLIEFNFLNSRNTCQYGIIIWDGLFLMIFCHQLKYWRFVESAAKVELLEMIHPWTNWSKFCGDRFSKEKSTVRLKYYERCYLPS